MSLFTGLTPALKSLYAGIALIALLVVMWLGGQLFNALGFFDSDAKQQVIELKEQEQQLKGQVDGLTKEIAEERAEKEQFKQVAEDKAQEALIYKAAAEASSKRAADEAEKLVAEDKRYVEELERNDNSDITAYQRCLKNCESAKRLLKGFKGPCECDDLKE
jgi:hypothetical protein